MFNSIAIWHMAQKHGQQKLDEINQKIIEDGLKPTSKIPHRRY